MARSAKFSGTYKTAGRMSDGVTILSPKTKLTHFTTGEIRSTIQKVLRNDGAGRAPTSSPLDPEDPRTRKGWIPGASSRDVFINCSLPYRRAAGLSSRFATPTARLRPVWAWTDSGWRAIEASEPPTSTFAPSPTATVAWAEAPV